MSRYRAVKHAVLVELKSTMPAYPPTSGYVGKPKKTVREVPSLVAQSMERVMSYLSSGGNVPAAGIV
jgi:hypothetical protein